MKKLFTALVLLMCTATAIFAQSHFSAPRTYHIAPNSIRPPHHTPSNNRSVVCDSSLLLDYNTYAEVIANNLGINFNGSWNATNPQVQAQELSGISNSTLYPSEAYNYNYAAVRYDSIVFGDLSTFSTVYAPRATSTIYLDSLGMFIGVFGDTVHAHNVMLHDSLVFKIYSITGTTLGATPVKTIVYTGYNQLSQFFNGENFLHYTQIPVHQQFTAGQSFAVRMDYRQSDTSSHCILSYTYADSCGTIVYNGQTLSSPAYVPALPNSTYYGQIGATGNTVTAGYNTNYYNIGVSQNCEFVYTQNFEFLPIINICQTISGTAPTVVTTAASNVASVTATVNGTVNAQGDPSTVTFNWGLTTAYGNNATGVPSPISGSTVTATLANLSGLTANTTYHYRISATNTTGTSVGADMTFTTLANGTVCTPDGNVTTGMSPSAANVPCVTKGTAYSQTFTFVVPAQATSIRIDSIVNLPAGFTWAANQSPPTYAGGTSGCFIVSGNTNAPCGQYKMLIYVTITVPGLGSQSGELSALATTFGIPGYSSEYFRVIAAGDACPTVNTSQTANYAAYANCGGASTITLTTTHTDVNCFGQSTGSATVSATGGTTYTYSWSGNGGSAATASNLAAGTYTVTVSSNGTSATATVTITQPSAALAVTASSTQTSCSSNSGTATAVATGGTTAYNYAWTGGLSGANINNLAAGIYNVTVTDNKGCTATATTTVASPASFTISVTTTAVTCYGQSTGSATVTVTGGSNLTYAWSGNGGSAATASNLAAGTYTVTVTDGSGCSRTGTGTVTQPANAFTVSASSTASSCGNSTGSVTATVANNVGSPTYLWNNSGASTTATVSSLGAGVYSVTATAGGCTATASVAVNNSNGPTVTVTKTDPTCFNSTNGSVTTVVSGGSTPYTYTWSNNTHNSSITGVGAGSYTVVVSDNNQCQGTSIVTLVQPDPITFNQTVNNVNCNGASSGSIVLAVAGGTSPYQYQWSNNTSASSVTSVAAGSFTVTVTDSKSCTAVSTNTITQPTALTATVATTPSTGNNGVATANAVGGTSPYSYSWSNSQTSSTINGLAPGAYIVTVTDSKGCATSATGTIISTGINEVAEQIANVTLFPNPANDMINVVVELQNTSTIQLSVTDLTGKVIYTTRQTASGKLTQNVDVSAFAAGVYIVEVTTGEQSIRNRFVVSH